MRADNSSYLVAAAKQRHELVRSKAVQALRQLDRAGTPVTFETVARDAGVSRSWLYTQPDLRNEIQRLRDTTRRAAAPNIPAAQRSTAPSLLRRLEAANERNRQLHDENQRLRRQLAHALGDKRATRSQSDDNHPREAAD
jgi:hypothetical protein